MESTSIAHKDRKKELPDAVLSAGARSGWRPRLKPTKSLQALNVRLISSTNSSSQLMGSLQNAMGEAYGRIAHLSQPSAFGFFKPVVAMTLCNIGTSDFINLQLLLI